MQPADPDTHRDPTASRGTSLETHFAPFRDRIIGIDQTFVSPFGAQRIIYADWVASGRLYAPIERTLIEQFGPYVGNTHTEITVTRSVIVPIMPRTKSSRHM